LANSSQELDLQQAPASFEYEDLIDKKIDLFLADKGSREDLLSLEEKKLVIKELALANKRAEIVPKLNDLRAQRSLPALNAGFDIFYYAKEYSEIIEDVSLEYAKNISKKYRFANRVTRIAKLNDLAESILDRIAKREELFGGQHEHDPKEEAAHNFNIKLFSQLIGSIDEQMGRLKMTRIDVKVDSANSVTSAEDVKRLIGDVMKKYSGQLPSAVDANFTNVTDYEKCHYGEEWTNTTHCKYHNAQCKVQTGEISTCPFFLNRVLLSNREWMAGRYLKDGLSRRQIAELAGCKEIDERATDVVKRKLDDLGLWGTPKESS
jgi:hypothetical protein